MADHKRVCVKCEKEFTSKNPDAKVCSVACRNRLNASAPKTVIYLPRSCEQCRKEYVPTMIRQKFCCQACFRKHDYAKHIDQKRAYDRIKIKKQRIGLNIRDEHLQTPSRHAKWLWDGIGKWSVKYWPEIQDCLECNTHVYRHNANGVCEYCYDKLRGRDDEKLKEWKKKAYEKKKAAGRPFSRQVSKEWIQRAKEQTIPITPKISNLLDNLENL